ncbi:MAG: FG-GAP repeat domain-containing protein [Janthinobacterium lividum]
MAHFSAKLVVSQLLLAWPVAQAVQAQTATFAAAVTYSAGVNSKPEDVAIADLNADGKADLVTANNTSNTVGVLLGNGNGTFQAVVTYPIGGNSNPVGVAVADVNGDGKPDLLEVNLYDATVGVLLGNGNGTFQAVLFYQAGILNPGGLVVADMNGDTKPDIIMPDAYGSGNYVSILFGTGTGTFPNGVIYPMTANSSPAAVAVADVNGDGRPDVFTANNNDSSMGVLLTAGTSFQAPVAYSAGSGAVPKSVAVADVNADGKPDVFTTSEAYSTSTASVFLGNGNGTFKTAVPYSTGSTSEPSGIRIADMNGDGKLDLITANKFASSAGILLGTGTGTFQAVTAYAAGSFGFPQALAVGDVNGDRKPDIITANSTSNTLGVLLNTTAGTFLPTRAALPGTAAALSPNPAHASATLAATGLPAAARTVEATLLSPVGQVVRRFSMPAALGAATATVPTAGLAPGLYLLRLDAVDAQGAALGALPVQRLSVE